MVYKGKKTGCKSVQELFILDALQDGPLSGANIRDLLGELKLMSSKPAFYGVVKRMLDECLITAQRYKGKRPETIYSITHEGVLRMTAEKELACKLFEKESKPS